MTFHRYCRRSFVASNAYSIGYAIALPSVSIGYSIGGVPSPHTPMAMEAPIAGPGGRSGTPISGGAAAASSPRAAVRATVETNQSILPMPSHLSIARRAARAIAAGSRVLTPLAR
jgi:hypothetical protein